MRKLISVFMSLLLLASFASQAQDRYKAGDKAIGFNLMGVDKQMVSTDDYEDAKGFIVIFSCNTCPWVKLYEDRIQGLHETFTDKGWPVLVINPNDADRSPGDSFAKMQERAKNKNFTFPYLYDETQEIARAYGATKTPEVFLLEKVEDDLIVRFTGAIDDSPRSAENAGVKYVEEAVEAIEAGKEVSVKEAKAIGCGVKYKTS